MKKLISVILCFAIILSFSACSFSSGNAVFSIGTSDSVNSFNPLHAQTQAELMLSTNCFDGLLRFDETGKINLAGATAYTIEKNGLSYVFKLNPNAQWHISSQAKELINDNNFENKITASDYVYGFEKFREVSTELDCIDSITATDDFTLKITLGRQECDFLYKLASLPFYPCNQLFFEAAGANYASSPEMLLCNGPYYIEKQEEKAILLARNPYYNSNVQIKNKQVYLYTETAPGLLADNFKNDTYNLYISDSIGNKIPKAVSSSVSYDKVWGIAFNCKSKLGSSEEFRQVLMSTIAATDDFILPAFATEKATTIFPPTYTVNDVCFKNTDYTVKPREYNEKKALSTLTALQSKYKIESYTVSFAVPYDTKALADEIIKDWKAVFDDKIQVTLSFFNKEDFQTIADNGNYDIAILPITTQRNTAYSLMSNLFGAPCYCDVAEISSLVNNLGTIATDSFDAYANTENHLTQNYIFAPLFYTGKSLYIADGFKGVYLADGGKHIYFHGGEEL